MALTIERLKALYRYDPDTGVFYRLAQRGAGLAGPVKRRPDSDGYLRLCIDYRSFQQHRLAWFYMTGAWPELVDHKNHDKTDNRWCNLREADQSLNQLNRAGARRGSQTGLLGVHTTKSGKFRSSIKVRGQQRFLGEFDTAEGARAANAAARAELC